MMSMSMSVRNTYQIERRWIIMSRGRVGDKPFVRVVVSLEWCTCKRLIAPDLYYECFDNCDNYSNSAGNMMGQQ